MSNETEQLEEALEADQAAHGDGGTAGTAAPVPDDTQPPTEQPAQPKKAAPAKKKAAKKKPKPTPAAKSDSLAESRKAQDAARKVRIRQAEVEAPIAEITDEDVAEEKRRAALRAELDETATLIEEAEATIDALKKKARDLMAELYPQNVKSDRHVDAVRGYLASSQQERQNRGAHPARLKELLARAGKAPIDAAFQRARSRGTHRPSRSPINAGQAPAADQAQAATPGAEG